MKRILLLFISIASFASAKAQNASPVILNLTATHNTVANQVTFDFDLSDAENDMCGVELRVSGDGGLTWLIGLDSITGDTGYPQTPGAGKSIVWTYDPFTLTAQTGSGPVNFQARVIAYDLNAPDIQNIVDQVDSARLVQTLQFVEGTRHRTAAPAHLQEVRDSIENLMAANGLQDWHHFFPFGGTQGRNFSGRLPGLLDEPTTYLISGHYDTEPNTPGADDNGTATAAVMEMTRIFSGYQFRHSIRSIGFDLEESGLLGSFYYVANEIPAWENVDGLLNMEMIGYYDDNPNTQSLPAGFNILFPDAYNAVVSDSSRGNFLTNVANVASNSLKETFDTCAATYVPDLRVISLAAPGNSTVAPDLRRSDHAPFWDGGYKALMLTDAANLRNPNYHTPGDSIATLDLDFYVKNVKAVLATLVKLADPLNASFSVSNPFTIDVPVNLTDQMEMDQFLVYPNPSSGRFKITFASDGNSPVQINCYNIKGEKVAEVCNQQYTAGNKTIAWTAEDEQGETFANGNYFLKYTHGDRTATRRITIQH